VQPQQLGTAGVVVLFQPVREDGPAVLGLGLFDDALEKGVEHGRLRCEGCRIPGQHLR
jgi:hypothetical protein